MALSPGRAQYLGIKRQYPDAILFYQSGDFYELYDEDAEIGARELEIALTSRIYGDGRVPMAGVPIHAADAYISRLVGRGYRVAMCQQTSFPPGKTSSHNGVINAKNGSGSVPTCDHHATRYQAQYYDTRSWHKVPKRQL